MGDAHDSGVAKSSLAGTKRKVNALPTKRGWPVRIGLVLRSHTLRKPFFNNKVVSVAVVTLERISIASCDSVSFVLSVIFTLLSQSQPIDAFAASPSGLGLQGPQQRA